MGECRLREASGGATDLLETVRGDPSNGNARHEEAAPKAGLSLGHRDEDVVAVAGSIGLLPDGPHSLVRKSLLGCAQNERTQPHP
jgi:hypothetical protein